VEELLKVCVVDMREDPEQLAVQVLTSENVVVGEIVGSGGERGWIVEKVLTPSEKQSRCRQVRQV